MIPALTDPFDRLLGFPVIYDKDIPKGTVYLLNGNTMFFGTWVAPIRQSVASIITMQRRRRHK